MRLEEHLTSLERELENINWDILGISKTRLAREATTKLKSGDELFQRNSDATHLDGVALLIHRRIKPSHQDESDRIVMLLRLNRRYSLQVIQAYTPTSTSQIEDIERFYEDFIEARKSEKLHFTIIISDFNAKCYSPKDYIR